MRSEIPPLKSLVKGALTFVPVVRELLLRQQGETGSLSGAYCYELWLKHLTLLNYYGMTKLPSSLAELGPGSSMGTGLAALLSGIDEYSALDVIRYNNAEANQRVLDELVALFGQRAGRPQKGWPDYDDYLDVRLFPSHILTEEQLRRSLTPKRIESIRCAIICGETQGTGVSIRHQAPWTDPNIISSNSVDVVLSHSVMEHVADVEHAYDAVSQWLKPGGYMSHQIDFTSHGLARRWNGFRAYPEFVWTTMMGKRPFLINRIPVSEHVNQIRKLDCEVICCLKNYQPNGISRAQLAPCWKALSDDDLNCSGAFIMARKR